VQLDLPAVLDALLEDPEVVADAVADRGQGERRERVHEARGQPAKAAVAEAGIALLLQDLAEVGSALRGQALRGLVEAEVQQAEPEAPPGQELGREVGDALDVVLEVRALGRQPAVHQAVAHGVRERAVEIGRRGLARVLRARVEQVVDDGLAEGARLHADAGRPVRAHAARCRDERRLGAHTCSTRTSTTIDSRPAPL
jgi:hypothetical protein